MDIFTEGILIKSVTLRMWSARIRDDLSCSASLAKIRKAMSNPEARPGALVSIKIIESTGINKCKDKEIVVWVDLETGKYGRAHAADEDEHTTETGRAFKAIESDRTQSNAIVEIVVNKYLKSWAEKFGREVRREPRKQ